MTAAHAAPSSGQIFLHLDAPVYRLPMGPGPEKVKVKRCYTEAQNETSKICQKYGSATSNDALILKHSLVRQLKLAET